MIIESYLQCSLHLYIMCIVCRRVIAGRKGFIQLNIKRITVIDTGGVTARAIARRLRALKSFAVIEDAAGLSPESFSERVIGVVIAGDCSALSADNSSLTAALASGLPVLALGLNAGALSEAMGGSIAGLRVEKSTSPVKFAPCALFDGVSACDRYFERALDIVLPEGADCIAEGGDGFTAAFADMSRGIYAVQFNVESNDPDGMKILKNFASSVCADAGAWTMPAFLDECISSLRAACPTGEVVVAVSGGVMSTVAAALAARAFGERAKFVMCDTGLLRKGETKRVADMFSTELGITIKIIDLSREIYDSLAGASGKKQKREAVMRVMLKALTGEGDCIVRGSGRAGTFALVPLETLFKEEAKELGELMGLNAALLARQPFPESGLALRVSGEVTPEGISLLREVDDIFTGEIEAAGLDKKLWQYYATLSAADDGEYSIALHALVSSESLAGYAFRLPYDLIERTVMRVMRDNPKVGGVLYDVTGR